MPIFVALFTLMLAELAGFIIVVGQIGVALTLLLTVATAFAGAVLLRRQGVEALRQIRADVAASRVPGLKLADAAMIAAAGVLLVTPGFITDTLGFLLFVPPIRAWALSELARRLDIRIIKARPAHAGRAPVIELERGEFVSDRRQAGPWPTAGRPPGER